MSMLRWIKNNPATIAATICVGVGVLSVLALGAFIVVVIIMYWSAMWPWLVGACVGACVLAAPGLIEKAQDEYYNRQNNRENIQ